MTRLHWLGAALVFLGSTAAGFALRQELRLRLRLLTAVIDSLNLLRSDIVGRLLPLPEALRHLAAEEVTLFPAFEQRTGMVMGPTRVMRAEHDQMRQLIDAAEEALTARDAEEYSGTAETLLIMTQQHNMKEENILYPMCDQHLADMMETFLPQLAKEIKP